MTCGCSKSWITDGPFANEGRASAVMCMLCVEREGQTCGVTQLTLRRMMVKGCPRGHHPKSPFDPTLTWLGLRWYGVPAPLRWLLRLLIALRRVRPLTGPLDGCGCIAPLRDKWEALSARLRALREHARLAATGRLAK